VFFILELVYLILISWKVWILKKWVLEQFAINYGAMMIACGEDNLNPEELQSCLDAFDEVREFCAIESAEQCDDEEMEQLEQKLLDL
jgi:hypothetical protein